MTHGRWTILGGIYEAGAFFSCQARALLQSRGGTRVIGESLTAVQEPLLLEPGGGGDRTRCTRAQSERPGRGDQMVPRYDCASGCDLLIGLVVPIISDH